MSLVERAMEPILLLIPTRQEDGLGGMETAWQAGPALRAAFLLRSFQEAEIAQQPGQKRRYTLLTDWDTPLRRNDRILRERDGQVLRLLTDPSEAKTPETAGLRLSQAEAEAIDP